MENFNLAHTHADERKRLLTLYEKKNKENIPEDMGY